VFRLLAAHFAALVQLDAEIAQQPLVVAAQPAHAERARVGAAQHVAEHRQARVAQLGYMLCPHCDAEIERDFLRCPNCMRRLKSPCVNCSRPLDPRWKVCPYCEAEVAQGEPQPARRRRRRTGTTAEQTAVAEVTEAQAPPSP